MGLQAKNNQQICVCARATRRKERGGGGGVVSGRRAFFHPQLSSQPSKLIAGQLVSMLVSVKKGKVFFTAYQISRQKVDVSFFVFVFYLSFVFFLDFSQILIIHKQCGDEPKSNQWNELLKRCFPQRQGWCLNRFMVHLAANTKKITIYLSQA